MFLGKFNRGGRSAKTTGSIGVVSGTLSFCFGGVCTMSGADSLVFICVIFRLERCIKYIPVTNINKATAKDV